jgi:hypothetical protein
VTDLDPEQLREDGRAPEICSEISPVICPEFLPEILPEIPGFLSGVRLVFCLDSGPIMTAFSSRRIGWLGFCLGFCSGFCLGFRLGNTQQIAFNNSWG